MTSDSALVLQPRGNPAIAIAVGLLEKHSHILQICNKRGGRKKEGLEGLGVVDMGGLCLVSNFGIDLALDYPAEQTKQTATELNMQTRVCNVTADELRRTESSSRSEILPSLDFPATARPFLNCPLMLT